MEVDLVYRFTYLAHLVFVCFDFCMSFSVVIHWAKKTVLFRKKCSKEIGLCNS